MNISVHPQEAVFREGKDERPSSLPGFQNLPCAPKMESQVGLSVLVTPVLFEHA